VHHLAAVPTLPPSRPPVSSRSRSDHLVGSWALAASAQDLLHRHGGGRRPRHVWVAVWTPRCRTLCCPTWVGRAASRTRFGSALSIFRTAASSGRSGVSCAHAKRRRHWCLILERSVVRWGGQHRARASGAPHRYSGGPRRVGRVGCPVRVRRASFAGCWCLILERSVVRWGGQRRTRVSGAPRRYSGGPRRVGGVGCPVRVRVCVRRGVVAGA
jgi:hypothetical protein